MDKIDFVNSTQPALNDTNLNLMQDNIERAINAQVSGDTLPIGTLLPFSGTNIPENWLLCDGRAISRTDYGQLFQVIGTTYGVGDGSTTFNLPNLKGRVPVGIDGTQTEFDTLGETGGEKTHTLTVDEMPSHNHTFRANLSFTGSGSDGTGLKQGTDTRPSDTIANRGGNQAHNNLQPYIVQKYIIKAFQTAGTVAQILNTRSSSTTDAYSADYINNLSTYSTTETVVGTWIDGKPIYRTVVNIGQLSSNIGQTNYAHGIANIDTFINVTGIINNGTEWFNFNSVYRAVDNITYDLGLLANKTNITYTTRTDRSAYTGIVILEYTKTTD